MKCTLEITVLTAFAALMAATPAFGIWSTYPNDQPLVCDYGPQPIIKAINGSRRVHGEGSGRADATFYFLGNTDDVNLFLSRVAEEQGVMLEVELSSPPGTYSLPANSFRGAATVDCTWTLLLHPNQERDRGGPRDGEPPLDYEKRREAERAKQPELAALITIHCAGPIDLGRLTFPLRFRARVDDRLSTLVEAHNSRRDAAEKSGTPLQVLLVTSEPAGETPQSPLFGRAATRPAGR